ncbi:MAG: hypothetical protein OXR68_05195 [Alphaproteobacteria bacterium]|nr:hypothetical protein [Alphaproteobacteria bacterium]MDD9919999.1 hypothetical protein [Alphaproteobacteria bacterium]
MEYDELSLGFQYLEDLDNWLAENLKGELTEENATEIISLGIEKYDCQLVVPVAWPARLGFKGMEGFYESLLWFVRAYNDTNPNEEPIKLCILYIPELDSGSMYDCDEEDGVIADAAKAAFSIPSSGAHSSVRH